MTPIICHADGRKHLHFSTLSLKCAYKFELLTKRKTPQVIDLQDFKGAWWDSNPRHSEPQSDALTN